jgi:hypothetical protein
MSEKDKTIIFRVVVLVLIAMLVQLFVIGYVFYSTYLDRISLVDYQRGGCERAKLDRTVNSRGWRIAEGARRNNGELDVANEYAAIARSLETRTGENLNCDEAFPKEGIFP